MRASRCNIAVAANSPWNLLIFRRGLLLRLREEGFDSVLILPDDPHADPSLDELGFDRAYVEISRSGLNPIADTRLLLSYSRILRRVSPAAFLGFTIKPNIYGCLAARWTDIPAIANISGLGTVFMKHTPLTWFVIHLYRFALKKAAIVFFQNPDDRDLFLTNRIVRTEQARLLPGSGIDLKHFEPRELPQGPVKLLMIARLLGDKGVREYAQAAQIVRRAHPHVRFQLLGPVDEGNRTAIRKHELDEWIAQGLVEYLGAAEDVRPYIEASTAIVLPSYREGLPRSLLEGAAMARPLIATDVPGCRELVVEGVTGFLCEARSADSLAAAMIKLIDLDDAARARLGMAARELAEREYNEERVIGAYLDALKSLCSTPLAS
jgi:glycosyltransferase involved in cell wall biosynthesis